MLRYFFIQMLMSMQNYISRYLSISFISIDKIFDRVMIYKVETPIVVAALKPKKVKKIFLYSNRI